MVLGVVLAFAAAIGFGAGTFLQHLSAEEVEHPDEHHHTERGLLSLLTALIRRPRWLIGQALAGGGTALQFSALAFAPVAVVQPILGAGLPVALVLDLLWQRRMPSARLTVGLVLCVVGLALFILSARPGTPRHGPGILAGALLLGLAVGLALAARFAPGGPHGSLMSGAASGATLGIATVSVAIPIQHLKTAGLAPTLTHWGPYLAVVTGLLATAATQQAYARGRLAWSLPALTVTSTLAAMLLSVFTLREQVDTSTAPQWFTGAVLAVVGAAVTGTRPVRTPAAGTTSTFTNDEGTAS